MKWLRTVIRLIYCTWKWFWQFLFNKKIERYGRRKQTFEKSSNTFPHHPPKPKWVKSEVIRLKALMPNEGHRKIAFAFNRLYAHKRQMTVGRTFVGYTIRNHQYEIQVLRRKLKHRPPKLIPKNLVWAMDLTGKTDVEKIQHSVLGIIEHHSRACLSLKGILNKSTITLLRCLLDCIEQFEQKPKIIRTDNEAIFSSRLFRFGLWLLQIKHQRIERACPWQNGRIERLFGTLKEKLNVWEVDSLKSLNHSLHLFQFWYNHIRPHQNLNGLTPAEVWRGKVDFYRSNKSLHWFNEWEGLLTGYYLPP
ncbi:MAG: transposase [Proteobacteria bacterium]|nr:transposase [Pseudomonadota bacterium]NOG58886.1 transposase [Pseudomonadota bacterium]